MSLAGLTEIAEVKKTNQTAFVFRTENEPNSILYQIQKKGLKIDSHVSNTSSLLISFSRGFGPPLNVSPDL